MNQNTVSAPPIVRTCGCGAKFVPPSAAPRAERCRKCHRAFLQQQAATEAVRREAAERKSAPVLVAEALKETYLAGGTIPKSAKVEKRPMRRGGEQIVVSWMGRSTTFYVKN